MTDRIELRSDNASGVAPEILAALAGANEGSALAYGGDDWTARMQRKVGEVFERDDVSVFPVVSGTAANALALSALCPPWGAVICHETAHIIRNEAGATSMFGAGAVMIGLAGEGSLLTADGLEATFAATGWGDPHNSQPSVLSVTCPTDMGALYTPDRIRALADTAKARGLRVHLDGARIANAIAALDCTPAELTWRAGVDVFSLGATKNGALSTDAIVSFDADVSAQLVYRTKRAGHVASKMRYQSVQIERYLTDGLWLRMASHANAMMARLGDGLAALGVDLLAEPEVNMVFVRVDDATADRLEAAGLDFYRMGDGTIRLVTSFQSTGAGVEAALAAFTRAIG